MPRSKIAALSLGLCLSLGLVAMTGTAMAQAAEASARPAAAWMPSKAMIAGKGIVVIPDKLMNLSIKQHPNSYTGGLTTVTVMMGEKFRDLAVPTFGPHFSEGVEYAAVQEAGAYNITLRLDGFSFKYDQLSTLGFAVSPQVTIIVTADVTDPSGAVILHKAYRRTNYSAGAYILSFKPRQRVVASLDKALDEIFNDMTTDIAAAIPVPVAVPETGLIPAEVPFEAPVDGAISAETPDAGQAPEAPVTPQNGVIPPPVIESVPVAEPAPGDTTASEPAPVSPQN